MHEISSCESSETHMECMKLCTSAYRTTIYVATNLWSETLECVNVLDVQSLPHPVLVGAGGEGENPTKLHRFRHPYLVQLIQELPVPAHL